MLVLCLTWAAPRQIGPQPQEFYFKNNFNQQQRNEENLVETPGLIQNKTGVVSSVSDLKSLYKTSLYAATIHTLYALQDVRCHDN